MKRIRAVPTAGKFVVIPRSQSAATRRLHTAPKACTYTVPHKHSRLPLTTTTLTPTQGVLSSRRNASSTSAPTDLKHTPLHDLHVAHGAKFVPFANHAMPIQYASLPVLASHHFTRTACSIFDVSHMVQHSFTGPGADAFLAKITPSSTTGIGKMQSTLSVLLWESGGICDDTILTRLGNEDWFVVTNAGCRDKDLEFLGNELQKWREAGGEEVVWGVLDGKGLVALQGPASEGVLQAVLAEPEKAKLREMYFGTSKFVKAKLPGGKLSSDLLVSRGGYTGEDGFEISIPGDEAVAVTEALLSANPDTVHLAGLGARDSLRLEAGMCLYGHDLNDDITPVEAGLSWVIGKDRRAEGGFNGSELILKQLVPKTKGGLGVEKRRVGFIIEGAPAREGASIVNSEGEEIGKITSGGPSPTLGKNVAMGYIKDGFHKSGTGVEVVVRGKKRQAKVTKMPFVPSKYYKGAAPS